MRGEKACGHSLPHRCSLGLSPVADYSDADTEFIGGVSGGVRSGPVDKVMIDQLIADGHEVCSLMDAGQYDVITSYIQCKYQTDAAYPMYFFAWSAAKAYCPWHSKGLAEGGALAHPAEPQALRFTTSRSTPY
jgi:hypothetical protein